ncbi:hypothetical protein C6P45_000327 [Maudiozyma exigua]|uniref:Anaphase-promoting complex subunit 4 n=1 Tax=Maudiozyma exigua TaxID=34358 RepID=A0A9P6W8K4_MAUEX|nr:hypothetical protein C6P45_000327 [Kazachstania exigua]
MNEEEFYRVEDPEQDLYLTRIEKNIVVRRRSDDEPISSTYIRDWAQLNDCHWDTIMGQFLSIVFTDGSIRLIDVNDNGKLISLIRTTLSNVDASYWGRIIEVGIDSDSTIMNISRSFPKLIKYSMENGSIKMEPFNLVSKKWRQGMNSTFEEEYLRIIDVHMLHSDINDTTSFILNGGITFNKPGNFPGSKLCKIIREKPDIFELWYCDGRKKTMDLTPIVSSRNNMCLIEDIMEFQELLQYLRHHVNFLQNNIIKPYADFLNRVTSVAYDRHKLYQELRQLILTGEVSDELSDWLQYTIGERNILKWEEMAARTYQKTTEILELSIMPAIERTIILTQRCSGLLIVLDSSIGSSLPEIDNINDRLVDIGAQVINELKKTIKDSEYVKQFLNWLHDYVYEISEIENFSPKVQYNYEPTIVTHLIATLKPICLSDIPTDSFFPIDEFNIKLKEVTDIVKNEIINKYIIPKVESLVLAKEDHNTIFPNHEQMKYYKLLDIDIFETGKQTKNVAIMIYKCSQDPNVDRVSVGTMEGIFVHLTLPPCQVTSARLTATQAYELRTGHIRMFRVILESILIETGTIEYLEYIFEIKPITRGITIGYDRNASSYATDWFSQNFTIEQISPPMTENYYITSQPI